MEFEHTNFGKSTIYKYGIAQKTLKVKYLFLFLYYVPIIK